MWYEYRCDECRSGHAERRPIVERDNPAYCPTCGKKIKRIISTPNVVFKGKDYMQTGFPGRDAKVQEQKRQELVDNVNRMGQPE